MGIKEKMKSLSLISGNMIFAFSQFVILSIITKNYDKISLGYFTLAISITAPVFLLLQMNYRTVYATSSDNQIGFNKIRFLSLSQSVFALIISLLIVCFIYRNLELLVVTFCIGLSKLIEGIQEVSYGYYQKEKKINKIAISKGLRGLLSIIICYLLVYSLHVNIYVASLSYFFSWIVTFIVYDFGNIGIISEFYTGKSSIEIIKLGIPLGVTVFLDSLVANSPRYYVSYFLGFTEVAYFSSLLYFMNLGQIVVTSITQTYISELSQSLDKNYLKYREIKRKLLLLSVIIGCLIIIFPFLFSDLILPMVFDETFLEYKNEFVLIMIAAAIWYIAGIYHTCILATRKFAKQSIIFITIFFIMQVLLIILVPKYGITGACISLIISYLIRLVISIWMLNKIEKEFII